MSFADLVTLADVQNWLDTPAGNTQRDAILTQLIRRVSMAVSTYTSRLIILPRTKTDVFNGNGRQRVQLLDWPVLSISSLVIGADVIPPATSLTSSGYILDVPDVDPPGSMQSVYLRGYWFQEGIQNVSVTYLVGYMVSGEVTTVTSSPYTVLAPYGPWGSDMGVTYTSSGTALVQVSSSPAQGQYSVVAGVYTFSTADVGQSVSVSYGYVPADMYNCVLEWIADVWARRDRPGVSSKSIGGAETVSYLRQTMPMAVAEGLRSYMRVI